MKITLAEVKGSKKFNKKKGKNVCRTTSTLYITPTQKPSLQKACAKINFLETIRPTFPLHKTATNGDNIGWNSTKGYLAVRETSDIQARAKKMAGSPRQKGRDTLFPFRL